VRQKRLQYGEMSLLELSPFVCTAGDIQIDVGYDRKQAATRLLRVWTAWKEYSHYRYSLIRSRAAITAQKAFFDMWRDAKQCTVETVLKVNAAVDMCDSNARRSPTLLELAHETDFVDGDNVEVVLGDESLFVPPSSESPSCDSCHSSKSLEGHRYGDDDGNTFDDVVFMAGLQEEGGKLGLPGPPHDLKQQTQFSLYAIAGEMSMADLALSANVSIQKEGPDDTNSKPIAEEEDSRSARMSSVTGPAANHLNLDMNSEGNRRMVLDDLFSSLPAPRLPILRAASKGKTSNPTEASTPESVLGFPPITPNFEAMLREIVDARVADITTSVLLQRDPHLKSTLLSSSRRYMQKADLQAARAKFPMHLVPDKENTWRLECETAVKKMGCMYTIEDPQKPFRRRYEDIYGGRDDAHTKVTRFDNY
jgi:hypothetical protein